MPLSFFSSFCFFHLVLFSSAWDTFYNLATLFDSNLLQPAFDFTTIFHTKSFHYKLQTAFQNTKRNEKKELQSFKKHVLYILSFYYISLFLELLPRSKVFTIIDNPGIYRLLSQCISISLIVKKDIFFILIFYSFRC